MVHRAPSTPPILPGYDYRYPLGTGGFADVFLYEQNLPHRQVAVKVLLAGLVDADVLRMFNAEADVMATLASHPSILTVYGAGISADGRPYLVMEYCPSPLIRRDAGGISAPLPVERVLHVGVKMASALETAHRAGVLHRDIKPSNILLTSFGAPVLGDFGIATSLAASRREELFAMSVPWSSPEVLEETTAGSVQSEVWSLGATLYTMLAGHAPFEKPGAGENSRSRQRARILRERPGALPSQTPAPVKTALMAALDKRPGSRPQSMVQFARMLQDAQDRLGLAVTPLELAIDEWAPGADAVDFGDSSLRGAVVSTVPVDTPRAQGRPRAAVRRTATGGSTVVAHRGDRAADRRIGAAALTAIVGGSVIVGVGATLGVLYLVGVV